MTGVPLLFIDTLVLQTPQRVTSCFVGMIKLRNYQVQVQVITKVMIYTSATIQVGGQYQKYKINTELFPYSQDLVLK